MPQLSTPSQLPNEIWLEILQLATLDSRCTAISHYIPFQSRASDVNDNDLGIKRNLSLVCRQWRQMTIELLYRDIRIARGGKGLREALQTKTADGTSIYGDWVQRAVLPFSSTITGPYDASICGASVDILALCSKLRILVRPPYDIVSHEPPFYSSEAQHISFPLLEHLEWWHNNEAERTGGINSLSAVLCTTPNLTYLYIAGLTGRSSIIPRYVSLPVLTTLHLRNLDGFLMHDIVDRWTLPALAHLILDDPAWYSQVLLLIWEKFGSQLRTVELGKHLRFLLKDVISPCLQGCPSLEEIHYYPLFTTSPVLQQAHYSLKTIGLYYAPNSYLLDQASVRSSLEQHFDLLSNRQLPLLQRIVLYGDWTKAMADPRFKPILERSVRRESFIVYPDGSRVSID